MKREIKLKVKKSNNDKIEYDVVYLVSGTFETECNGCADCINCGRSKQFFFNLDSFDESNVIENPHAVSLEDIETAIDNYNIYDELTRQDDVF